MLEFIYCLRLAIVEKKFGGGWVSKILRNFQSGSLKKITSNYKVGGWGEKRAFVIFEWSQTNYIFKKIAHELMIKIGKNYIKYAYVT